MSIDLHLADFAAMTDLDRHDNEMIILGVADEPPAR
jgi:hypothetical protein